MQLAHQVLLAGFFSQLLCLGIARFAYTPLLPPMIAAGLLPEQGAYLAAVNYLGYLAGALLASRLSQWRHKFYAYRASLLLALISTLGMALTTELYWWAGWRFLAGLAAAGSMLLASGLILQHLVALQQRPELGMHFAGLGGGIVLVAAAAELFAAVALSVTAQWACLSALALLLLWPAWRWLPPPLLQHSSETAAKSVPLTTTFRWLFYGMYFCAGFGYVVTVTFIVALAGQQAELAGVANLAFLLLGVGAASATLLWDRLARRWGYLATLRLALLFNAAAIVWPLLQGASWVLLGSAWLFGSSFIGCVSLVLTLAGRLYPAKPAQLMGKLTLCYGLAQTIAPAISGALLSYTRQYDEALWLAAAVVLAGVLALTVLLWLTPDSHPAKCREQGAPASA